MTSTEHKTITKLKRNMQKELRCPYEFIRLMGITDVFFDLQWAYDGYGVSPEHVKERIHKAYQDYCAEWAIDPEKDNMDYRDVVVEEIAKENNISYFFMPECVYYAKAIDVLKEVNPKIANEILNHETTLSFNCLVELGMTPPDQIKDEARLFPGRPVCYDYN